MNRKHNCKLWMYGMFSLFTGFVYIQAFLCTDTNTHSKQGTIKRFADIKPKKRGKESIYTHTWTFCTVHTECRQWKSEIYRQFASYIGTLSRIRQWDEQVIQRNAPQYIQNKSGADFHAQFRFCLHLSAVNIVGWCWVWYNLKFTCLPFLTRNAVLCIQFSYSWNCLYMTESIRQRRQQQSRQ